MNSRKDLMAPLAELHESLAEGLGERVNERRGKAYWRTLEEAAESPAFQELLRREFPQSATTAPLDRRRFLSLMSASLALAGVAGCSVRPAPEETLVPYVRPPEEIVPGRPLFFATAMTLLGRGVGLLVESHMGRPTKVEGNPDHPASLGGTNAFHQAWALGLYDPDRSQTVTHLGQTRTWPDAAAALRAALDGHRSRRGAGLRLLTETVISPTLGRQLRELLRMFPEAHWHQYEPLADDNAFRGRHLAFGEHLNEFVRLYDRLANRPLADVVVALDADFLGTWPDSVRLSSEFMAGRRVRTSAADAGAAIMNRLYVVEPEVTCTGAKADHRLAVRPSEIEPIARALAQRLGLSGIGADGDPRRGWIEAVARDLEQHRGRCVVLAGPRQPAAVHLLAAAMNERLGNLGTTVIHTEPLQVQPEEHAASLADLTVAMNAGQVETLVVLGGNPVYAAPADLGFREALARVPLRVHHGLYQDETARLCHWHLPETHGMEAWSDTRAFDGTASIVQPLIAPLYAGRSAHELVDMLTLSVERPGYEIVRSAWRRQWSEPTDFETRWRTAVHNGVIAGTRFETRQPRMRANWLSSLPPAPAPSGAEFELSFQPDATILDGRFANNAWLQELPKPLTKITWDNVVLMSPRTARDLGVGLGAYAHGGEHGGFHSDIVELRIGERNVHGPIWIMPGHVDGVVTIALGYGRESAGHIGGTSQSPVGFNANLLRTREHLWSAPDVRVAKTPRTMLVACTQEHQLMENRGLIRAATLSEYRNHPDFAGEPERESDREQMRRGVRRPLSLLESDPAPTQTNHRWSMAIDLTLCTGCSACVVACQAENNIPVVGKNEVARGREMHWLRIDRYHSGAAESPGEFHFQPVPCMQCENAPCEYVCPTEATVHSADGLNDQVYQRCVGTRFCSNNCPYKVRRFNFFHYAEPRGESLKLLFNPDVTVRDRGVMEKCTYCVQRIRHAEIDAAAAGRTIFDGEILTACQAACPSGAIVFGDARQPSKVRDWKETPLNYTLLAELNTEPRTSYLAALRNPNPELEGT